MKPALQLRLGQNLTLTPQLRQAIRLLQLSSIELESEINLALESNPLLERPEDAEPTPESTEREGESPEPEVVEKLDSGEDEFAPGPDWPDEEFGGGSEVGAIRPVATAACETGASAATTAGATIGPGCASTLTLTASSLTARPWSDSRASCERSGALLR